MHSLLPLSLCLTAFNLVNALKFPVEVRTGSHPTSTLARRAKTTIPIANNGNAQYIANITLAGETVRVLLDTGSSDLWVNFEGTPPATTNLGKSLTLNYAIGAASGNINTAPLQFDNYSVANQAFLLVTDASSFSSNIHKQGYDGLMGLGPNEGSQVFDKVGSDAGDSVLNSIFASNKSSSNFISFLLDRKGDPSEQFTGQFTISEYIPGFENISSMPQMDVETVHKLLASDQHWQALTDKDKGIIGPDGQVIQYSSIVPKAPDGQLVVVFDSGFTFSQVPRSISDAIYGRVQGAVYDTKNEWWTVPCGQLLNVTINMGGQSYPIHPLDTVDNSFGITDAQGNSVCIGTFQPITTAFSLLGNYDMIMGMSFLRNTYTLLNYGDWVQGNQSDPFIQFLSVTNLQAAHNDFVQTRLGGVDTTGDPKWALLPTSQMQHSPVSAEEKKKAYQEMILSRWPEIFVGCLVFVLLVAAFIIWRCCCRRRRMAKKAAAARNEIKGPFGSEQQPNTVYVPLEHRTASPAPSQKYGGDFPRDSYQHDPYANQYHNNGGYGYR